MSVQTTTSTSTTAANSFGLENLGSFRFSVGTKAIFGTFAAVGAVAFALAVKIAPDRAWPNFLVNFFFFLTLSLCGAFFTALQHITNAYWSVTVRRVAEGMMSFLPVALVLAVGVVAGGHHLYEWTHTEVVKQDHLLTLKAPYLNMTFFSVRLFLCLGLMLAMGWKMRANSLAQDATGEHKYTLSNIKLSALFIPAFAISFTILSFDLLMSLQPHWFSTIFGVYCFAGLFYGGLSLLAFLTIHGREKGFFNDKLVTENHIHDIGKLMFAFTVFWAYIMFSQLMLIWYANIPEETPYFILRFSGNLWPMSWWTVCNAVFLLHFVLPFLLLAPREAKRRPGYLKKMALLMLFSHWLDIYLMVMPVFHKDGPVFGWVEVGVFLGFVGIFVLSITRFLQRVPAVPVRDPRMERCLGHSQ